jgi:hypothetical protein
MSQNTVDGAIRKIACVIAPDHGAGIVSAERMLRRE